MGQAKNRGTYEERKAKAIERNEREAAIRTQVAMMRPSPKHTKLMAMVAGIIASDNPKAAI